MVFIYCLLSFISEAADNEHNLLLEIPVERSIFECNIQKSLTRSGDLTSFVKSSNLHYYKRLVPKFMNISV